MPLIDNVLIQPPVIAHRGASLIAPENTLAAFRKAKELGANWVEFDVMLTADHNVVVIHDRELNRTTNGKGLVIDHRYSYLKTLDAGSWFNPLFANEKIPLLEEVIELLYQLNLSANIEIKAQIGHEEITVEKVLEVIKNYWPESLPQPLISSFSLPILESVRAQSPESLIGYLMHGWHEDWLSHCDRLGCKTINVNYKLLNADKVRLIKKTNRLLLAYTVNDKNVAQELCSWGVDAIFSDNLKELIGYPLHCEVPAQR